ncbi:hypothetical protein [Pseudoxanthomonas sp. PXM04]|uniref:hypothetical protein n=1 Tax=Pseudoxanthomonas sp. PXM04 TaxID=2769297 RepID=UPI001782212A|nr:hypothetical protein [Pseudoxanthomonas sp. PXM04]MBD9377929.1 hypothetical protein [Pseudoxanthomonas sp. PXM04]
MNRNNKETRALSLRDRAKSLAKKVFVASSLSLVAVGSAMAQTAADYPADMAAAEGWLQGKAAPIIGFVLLMSMIIVGIKVAKMPRRA